MKKIPVFFQKCKCHLLILCYSVYVLFQLVTGVWGMASDSLLRASGKLQAQQLSVEDFQPVNLKEDGNGWRSETPDPQLLYVVDGYVTSLRIEMEFNAPAGELDLYYTQKPGENFDKYRRVWAVQQQDGSYLYTLPRTKIHMLRLDPGSAENLRISFGDIEINQLASVTRYFDISLHGLFCLVLYPALAAAILQYVLQVYPLLLHGKQHGKGSF